MPIPHSALSPEVVVQAAEIAERYPAVVEVDSPAMEAVRLLAEHSLPGIVVVTAEQQLYAVLPASQVVRFILPSYVQNDPVLASVFTEAMADRVAEKLGDKTIRDLLPRPQPTLAAVKGDDTIIEVAEVMERLRSPLVAVMRQHKVHGAITAPRLLAMALECGFTDSQPVPA
jgi:CBS domain-containing protein